MKKILMSAVPVLIGVLLLPSSAFGYLHLQNSRDALVGNPGDCDICAAIYPSSGPFRYQTYYRYSDSRIRNRIIYGPGYACFAVFESNGSDSSISDFLVRNVCVA